MPRPSVWSPGGSSGSVQRQQQQLPFTGDNVDERDFDAELADSFRGTSSNLKPNVSSSFTAGSFLSSSYGRTPARSFFHHAYHGAPDTPQYSSQGVREKTQELAGLALADVDSTAAASPLRAHQSSPRDPNPDSRSEERSFSSRHGPGSSNLSSSEIAITSGRSQSARSDSTSKPASARHSAESSHLELHVGDPTSLMPRDGRVKDNFKGSSPLPGEEEEGREDWNETSPLLPHRNPPKGQPSSRHVRRGGALARNLKTRTEELLDKARTGGKEKVRAVTDPHNWTRKAMTQHCLASVRVVSAVFLGLLLNILDGLSYGLILFPLGEDIFAKTGPDGISIFFLSCIVSQVVYSSGFSIFKGGVGSEMIEVVPFFHKQAYLIMGHMSTDNPQAVLATVIVSYAMSSVLTGLIFLALGAFKLGNLVSFFPRSILTGCIGGVGFFLVVTGIEVSARLDGNLEYNLDTLHKLFRGDTVMLWVLPLILSISIVTIRYFFKSPFILPAYFIGIGSIFYFIVGVVPQLNLDLLRQQGWIFPKPESGVPFYHFYSYYNFKLVNWGALAKTIPTMFALSFFGLLHVPINVPALGVAVKEDDVNINRELIAHGVSNALSGFVGSIQNYLVYANSVLFIHNGGDSRLAGLLLAAATTAVWVAGPAMIGFIPVCVVGTLIFMLGFELLEEAVWDTYGKLHSLEYLTIIAIVLIMGVYDFVAGIVAGILLACLNYVLQTSRTRAISAEYTGTIAESTVRRPRSDRRYLKQVKSQIRVEKLSGYLFFGTIVGVETKIRSLIDDETFRQDPVRYVIVDFSHVTGIDFSAAEAFTRINRILCRRQVRLMFSSVSFSDDVGKSLNMVGLLDQEMGDAECPPPQVFEDLNKALESCENDLLEPFYKRRGTMDRKSAKDTTPISIANAKDSGHSASKNGSLATPNSMMPAFQSPRRGLLMQAAESTIAELHGGNAVVAENNTLIPPKWTRFSQPTRIMLQTFEDVSSRNEDFWHRAAPYFKRHEFAAGTVLYTRGDEPDGFYLLEKGRFRAEYDLAQGKYYEVILPGTTCGELPFFSETERTSTVAAEEDCVAWLLTRENWRKIEEKEKDIAGELLKVGLKLTSERMNAVTSYVLVSAS